MSAKLGEFDRVAAELEKCRKQVQQLKVHET